MPMEEIMKTNKVTKLGVSLLSVASLGVVAPTLIDVPVFGVSIVKADENQEPLKYRITYCDSEAAVQIADEMTGTINPGETINIYKNIDGYEITSKYSWMPNYDMTYDIANEYFYGSRDGYNDMLLEYKKVEPTPKPEVKPEPAPKDEEKQEPLKYRIRYLDEHSREIVPMETGVLNPGESINIHKDIEGYQVVSSYAWMPGYNLTYNIASTFFYGASDGYMEGYLRYKKLDTAPTPDPNPEVKPETKPSETPKPEVKPETKPSETPKPEVKPETKPSDTPKPEVKPETKPSETPKPEVKPAPAPKDEEKQEPLKYRITYYDIETREMLGQMTGVISPGQTINIYKKFNGHEIISKDEWMPNYGMTYDIVNEYFYGSADGYNDLRLEYKKLDADAKPSDTSKPEVKPEPKPSETPKPEVKPEPKPSETPKPEVKPETKPSDTPKPEVKPAPKPSDTSKPEVKPELKPQTNSNTAPTVPVKPVGQTSNSKADKPTSKKETPALPNTGEQSSSLSLFGLLLASIGLAGLTYKGRH